MILITGASGFVGQALVESIIKTLPIRIAVRRMVARLPDNIDVVEAELHPEQDWKTSLVGVDVVIHCAARVHVMKETAVEPLAEFRRINVEGTLRLARQAAETGVRRFVFISSIKVNGEATELGSPFTADDEMAPEDPYGISKMEAELGLRELSLQTGMELVIIRPPLIYGPSVKANFAAMIRYLKSGIPLPLGGITTNCRSLVYIENLVDLIRVCIDHPEAKNQTFLVSDDETISTNTLLRKMANALGCEAHLVNIPPVMLKLAATLIGKNRIASRLCGSLQVDIKKTKELLDWSPPFTLEYGLKKTAESFLFDNATLLF